MTISFNRTLYLHILRASISCLLEVLKLQVLVFLDSHIEVNCDWLQPLLARIAASRSTVSVPIIDIINSDTFDYSSSPLVRGGFNWGLHFKWENLPVGTLAIEEDFVKPIRSLSVFVTIVSYIYCICCFGIWNCLTSEFCYAFLHKGMSMSICICEFKNHLIYFDGL